MRNYVEEILDDMRFVMTTEPYKSQYEFINPYYI